MKKIKLFYMGKRLRDIYPYASKWQVIKYRVRRFFHKLFLTTLASSLLIGAVWGGIKYGASTVEIEKVYADKEVIKEVIMEAPVLQRIAKCESGDTHYNKNGQVLMVANKNGTVDVGRYQINTVWHAKATELGLDITKEEDNKKMAEWIYAHRGTEDWYPSKQCWQK